MGGLLEELGIALSGGVAAAGKTASETLLEQAKQAALSLREENLVRITNLYAKEGRAEMQKFQTGERQAGQTFQTGERQAGETFRTGETEKKIKSEEKLAGQRETGESTRQQAGFTHTEGLAKITRDFQVNLQKETNRLSLELEKVKDVDARARLTIQYDNAVKVANLTANLDDKKKGTIARNAADLISMGLPKDRVNTLLVESLSGQKEKGHDYVTMVTSLLKNATVTGTQVTPAQYREITEEAQRATGFVPKAVIAPAPKSSFDEIAAKLFGKAPVIPTVSWTGGAGLIGTQMQTTPPSPERPDLSYYQREYDERMRREREQKYEASRPITPTGTSTLGRQ